MCDAWAGWSRCCGNIEFEARHAEETQAVDSDWAQQLQFVGLCSNPIQAAQKGSVEEKISDMTLNGDMPIGPPEMFLQILEIPPPLCRHRPETLSVASLLEFKLGWELLQWEMVTNAEALGDSHLVDAWAHFRRNWPTTARWSIFQSFETSDDFMEVLRRWNPELKSVSSAGSSGLEPRLDSFALSLSRKSLESWQCYW